MDIKVFESFSAQCVSRGRMRRLGPTFERRERDGNSDESIGIFAWDP